MIEYWSFWNSCIRPHWTNSVWTPVASTNWLVLYTLLERECYSFLEDNRKNFWNSFNLYLFFLYLNLWHINFMLITNRPINFLKITIRRLHIIIIIAVSYTHLFLSCVRIQCFTYPARLFCSLYLIVCEVFTECFLHMTQYVSVSYTHLDVYKRQNIHKLNIR